MCVINKFQNNRNELFFRFHDSLMLDDFECMTFTKHL